MITRERARTSRDDLIIAFDDSLLFDSPTSFAQRLRGVFDGMARVRVRPQIKGGGPLQRIGQGILAKAQQKTITNAALGRWIQGRLLQLHNTVLAATTFPWKGPVSLSQERLKLCKAEVSRFFAREIDLQDAWEPSPASASGWPMYFRRDFWCALAARCELVLVDGEEFFDLAIPKGLTISKRKLFAACRRLIPDIQRVLDRHRDPKIPVPIDVDVRRRIRDIRQHFGLKGLINRFDDDDYSPDALGNVLAEVTRIACRGRRRRTAAAASRQRTRPPEIPGTSQADAPIVAATDGAGALPRHPLAALVEVDQNSPRTPDVVLRRLLEQPHSLTYLESCDLLHCAALQNPRAQRRRIRDLYGQVIHKHPAVRGFLRMTVPEKRFQAEPALMLARKKRPDRSARRGQDVPPRRGGIDGSS